MSIWTQTTFDKLLSFRLTVSLSRKCTQKQSLMGAPPCQPSVFSPLLIRCFLTPSPSICFVLSLLPGVFIGHPMGERHTRVEVGRERERQCDTEKQSDGETKREKERRKR